MYKLIIIPVLTVLISVFAQDCGKYKKQIDSLMVEFNTIKDKMCDPTIDRDKYDDLNSIYSATWIEIVDTQKQQKKCLESQTKTVKVVVEPKKINSPLPMVLSVNWSSNRIQVKEQLRKNSDIKLMETDDGILEYHDGIYMGYKVEKWQFSFVDKKLYACQIVLKNEADLTALKMYEKVSKDLKSKYGQPSYEKNKFPSSYKSDSIKLTAIKNGSVAIYNKWLFKNDDIVRIGINENGSVLVTYLIDKLYKKVK